MTRMMIAGFTNSHSIRFVALKTSKRPLEDNSGRGQRRQIRCEASDRQRVKHKAKLW
jgi:hypothetical protein